MLERLKKVFMAGVCIVAVSMFSTAVLTGCPEEPEPVELDEEEMPEVDEEEEMEMPDLDDQEGLGM